MLSRAFIPLLLLQLQGLILQAAAQVSLTDCHLHGNIE